jgi:hypothetical protein
MNAMTSVRALALAAALMTVPAVAANAQAGWPSSQPQQSAWPSSPAQPQGQTAWPSNGPQAQPQPQPQPPQQQQAGWPSNASPAAPPQQAPWPANAPPGPPMAAPPMGGGFGGGGGGFGGGGGLGGGPSPAAQQECVGPFTALRAEVEKKGMAAKAGGEKQVAREEMCKLVTEYSVAETKWIKFAEANASKCGIPKQIVQQLKAVHAKTTDGQKKLCSAGPAGGPAAAPTLSDALGAATLPTREPEKKRKPGGTLDTLTGNALGQ